ALWYILAGAHGSAISQGTARGERTTVLSRALVQIENQIDEGQSTLARMKKTGKETALERRRRRRRLKSRLPPTAGPPQTLNTGSVFPLGPRGPGHGSPAYQRHDLPWPPVGSDTSHCRPPYRRRKRRWRPSDRVFLG